MAASSLGFALFLVCLSAAHVSGQEVVVKQVSTSSFVLAWDKEGEWQGVNTYSVSVKQDGEYFCEETVMCLLVSSCSFKTEKKCKKFSPCANVEATVTGGGYTAPASLMTAPAPVINITTGEGIQRKITWINPTSKCFSKTTAKITYGGYLDYTVDMGHDETSLTVPLCMRGTGSVTVFASGGDGESDAASKSLIRLSGNDAVSITDCPPEGCNDIFVEWEYMDVCHDVTHLKVTLGDDSFTTTDVTATNTTFEDLELNTQYNTCIFGLDRDDNVLARSCKSCGTQPEVVEELTLTNVTETTAEIKWEPPSCPTDGNFTYLVSYSLLGVEHTAVTAWTSYLWTDLNPGTEHNLCVTVLHQLVPSAKPTCIEAFTIPAAPNILVRVYDDYEEASLFVTWDGELLTPNFKYRVSWGDALEHSDYTMYKSYTIDGYNETAGPNDVCVEVETIDPAGLRSKATCQEAPFPNFRPDKPDHTHMIIGVSVSAGLAVLLSVVLVVVAKKQQPRNSTS